jgi:uncharacterized glyoxalase superfamily protein PhnB|tara:strand:- start:27 stop:458 length:432 start_codon:yes stop_codon:yes gene_type:complete
MHISAKISGETSMSETASLGPCTPFFIVGNLSISLEHYLEKMGFECRFMAPESDPQFAIVGRGQAQIMVKSIDGTVPPLPNPVRHEWARWDTFVHVAEPDLLAEELKGRGVAFKEPLADTDDGLRGFEIADPDGYVCFFGRPV